MQRKVGELNNIYFYRFEFICNMVLCQPERFCLGNRKVMIMAVKAKVFIVSHKHEADHTVFFVSHLYQQKNHELVCPGELVAQKYQADIKVFVVAHAHEASIKVMRSNFCS